MPLTPTATTAAETNESADRPPWQAGDRWVFKWKAGTDGGEYTTVIEEVSDAGLTARTGNEFRYYTPDGGLMSVVRSEQILAQYNPPLPLLQFPLKSGMSWQQGAGHDFTRSEREVYAAPRPGLSGEKFVHSC